MASGSRGAILLHPGAARLSAIRRTATLSVHEPWLDGAVPERLKGPDC